MVGEFLAKHGDDMIKLSGQHIFLSLAATICASIIGITIAIGVTEGKSRKMGEVILSVAAAAQSVPSIAVVSIVFIVVGIGFKPAFIALILYGLVPVVFNTTSGLLDVDPGVVQAARGIGYSRTQVLWKIKMPIAVPVIAAGIRSALIISIGTATVASLIGGGGLGDLIFKGLRLNRPMFLFAGSGCAALLAVIADTLFQFIEKALTPKGLRT